MALTIQSTMMLVNEAKRRSFEGRLLSLGEQDIRFGQAELSEMAKHCRFELRDIAGEPELARKKSLRSKDYLSMSYLMKSLGFESCSSLDQSDFEGAEIVFDLNSSEFPEEHREGYDVVLNGGTLEHVFHLPNALSNIHQFLNTNGRIIHAFAPSSNYMEHGFYQFSCAFFLDYYAANGYSVDTLQVLRHSLTDADAPYWVADYWPAFRYGIEGKLDSGDGHGYAIFCVATKSPGATCNVVPQQSHYQSVWQSELSRESDGGRL
ncbi:hypothetical protein IEN85_17940 [Pelagicoccus sp. NFK12]|uniref:Methyltransferase domain-containing protein n=2 Tax=Pelagicoccus enzymogenes TaxID=2773457 RepID=A0A927FAH5_9BACT|nr:hypothetical protein [Pelagicoccus enzymogenes]